MAVFTKGSERIVSNVPEDTSYYLSRGYNLEGSNGTALVPAGEDLRDYGFDAQQEGTEILPVPTADPVPVGPLTALDVGVIPVAGGVIRATQLATRVPSLIRPQYLTWLAAHSVGMRLSWASLPWWLRQALQGMGLTGVVVLVDSLLGPDIDIPFFPSLPLGRGDAMAPPRDVDIQIGGHVIHGRQIIGSWNTNPTDPANGQVFYRLDGGWLATQKKSGVWKTWKPKKPIVLFADGAKDLKTMLRADAALNKQAKKLATMLNRRAPRSRKAEKKAIPLNIVQGSGRLIDI